MRSYLRTVRREFYCYCIFSSEQIITPPSLSELLYLPMPSLPTTSQKTDSILIGANNANHLGEEDDTLHIEGGKWEDEEEKRFFEDVQDLKDFVPKSVLGVENEEGVEGDKQETEGEARQKERLEREKEEIKKLEEELEGLKLSEGKDGVANGDVANKTETEVEESKDEDDE